MASVIARLSAFSVLLFVICVGSTASSLKVAFCNLIVDGFIGLFGAGVRDDQVLLAQVVIEPLGIYHLSPRFGCYQFSLPSS